VSLGPYALCRTGLEVCNQLTFIFIAQPIGKQVSPSPSTSRTDTLTFVGLVIM
jgi:hypothetical protein